MKKEGSSVLSRYSASTEYLARAERVTMNAAQTLSKRADAFTRGAFPVAILRGVGCKVWTIDGTEMVDFICGLGALLLGHAHPSIERAVIQQLRQGHLASLPHAIEAETSERFCAVVGHEMVRWVSTGSEACTGAMRIARAATGRDMIVTSDQSYHGWHDVFAASRPVHPGIPEAMCQLIATFKYNDLEDLQRVLTQHQNNVACVIMEPCLHEEPHQDFLEEVKRLAHEAGALFILDEMIMGFRMAVGGASEYYAVKPDMAIYGKSIGGGLPLGCIVGAREYMQHSGFVSGTFSGNPLSLAACNAVLDVYRDTPVIETLWHNGRRFQDGVNDMIRVMGVPAICDGFPVKPRIRFTYELTQYHFGNAENYLVAEDHSVKERNLCMSLFLQELALHGMLWHPAGGNVSAAMTDQDIDLAVEAVAKALISVQAALASGDWKALHGEPIQATPYVRKT